MKQTKEMPSQERLHELFKYNHETGTITRRIQVSSGAKAGDIAGTSDRDGYRAIMISGKRYFSHRIIWMMVHGECPTDLEIDHENNIKYDNRLDNLRIGTQSENAHNRKNIKGYCFHKGRGQWLARMKLNSREKFLGWFNTESEASAAYQVAKAERDSHDYKKV